MPPIWSGDKKDEVKKDSDTISKVTRKEELLEEIKKILQEYGSESNIPQNSDYWNLLTEFRGLDKKE